MDLIAAWKKYIRQLRKKIRMQGVQGGKEKRTFCMLSPFTAEYNTADSRRNFCEAVSK